jgi:hypothetical protein
MGTIDCKYFEACDCPLCPLGSDKPVWYPGESVCRREGMPDWVARQRKVSRKVTAAGFWTKAMFEHDCKLYANIEGIDAETLTVNIPKAVENWKAKHPAITEETRAKRSETGKKNRVFLNAQLEKNSALYREQMGVV